MASFRQLPSGNWQATVNTGQRDIYVRRDKRQSKSFPKLSQARYWAARQEAEKASPSRP